MKASGAKAKGRRHQQAVAKLLQQAFSDYIQPEDIISTPMGVKGPDLMISPRGKKIVPLSVECKNVEKLNIWQAIEQAEAYAPEDTIPCVAFTKNIAKRYIAMDFGFFITLMKAYYEAKGYPIDPLPADWGRTSDLVCSAKGDCPGGNEEGDS